MPNPALRSHPITWKILQQFLGKCPHQILFPALDSGSPRILSLGVASSYTYLWGHLWCLHWVTTSGSFSQPMPWGTLDTLFSELYRLWGIVLFALFPLAVKFQLLVFCCLSNRLTWPCLVAFRLVVLFLKLLIFSRFSSIIQHCFASRNRRLCLMDPEIVVVNIFLQTLTLEVSVRKKYK